MGKHNGKIPWQVKTEQKEKSLSSENIFTPRKILVSVLRQKMQSEAIHVMAEHVMMVASYCCPHKKISAY
jgi:hypothetical protein